MYSLPSIGTYGDYSNGNYGANAMRVSVGPITLYFSYTTIVAFQTASTGLVVSENLWGPTTGKHLNKIDGGRKETRLDRDEFETKLDETMERLFSPQQEEA